MRQVEVIQYLQKEIGLESLEPPLEEVARLRLANREVNLKELGQLLSPPVGKSLDRVLDAPPGRNRPGIAPPPQAGG